MYRGNVQQHELLDVDSPLASTCRRGHASHGTSSESSYGELTGRIRSGHVALPTVDVDAHRCIQVNLS